MAMVVDNVTREALDSRLSIFDFSTPAEMRPSLFELMVAASCVRSRE
jgi:hypothetical protein